MPISSGHIYIDIYIIYITEQIVSLTKSYISTKEEVVNGYARKGVGISVIVCHKCGCHSIKCHCCLSWENCLFKCVLSLSNFLLSNFHVCL